MPKTTRSQQPTLPDAVVAGAVHRLEGRFDPRGLRGRRTGCAAVGLGAAALSAYSRDQLPRLHQRGHPGEVTEACLAQGLTAHGLPAGGCALHRSRAMVQRSHATGGPVWNGCQAPPVSGGGSDAGADAVSRQL